MEHINKRITEAFGKKIYLLGIDTDGRYVWLEEPKWDCSWYWGFGYIERYTNNQYPEKARDVESHTHWDSEIITDKNEPYIHHINESKLFKSTTLTESESWKLSELMKAFYILKEAASLFHSGSAGVSSSESKSELKNEQLYNTINKEMLPKIFKEIDSLLSP